MLAPFFPYVEDEDAGIDAEECPICLNVRDQDLYPEIALPHPTVPFLLRCQQWITLQMAFRTTFQGNVNQFILNRHRKLTANVELLFWSSVRCGWPE